MEAEGNLSIMAKTTASSLVVETKYKLPVSGLIDLVISRTISLMPIKSPLNRETEFAYFLSQATCGYPSITKSLLSLFDVQNIF